MTDYQKARREELENEWEVTKGGIKKSFREMLFEMKSLYERSSMKSSKEGLILYTDMKYEYVTAFKHSKRAS